MLCTRGGIRSPMRNGSTPRLHLVCLHEKTFMHRVGHSLRGPSWHSVCAIANTASNEPSVNDVRAYAG